MHQASYLPGRLRPRLAVLALVALLSVSACDETDPLATSSPSDPTEVATSDDAVVPADGLTEASVSYSGLPYGPIGLWASYKDVKWGPAPFSGSQNYSEPNGVITHINAARQKGQRLILALTGGSHKDYLTSGKFDLTKWKNRVNQYKTTKIKNAIAAGVSDGTIVGNLLIDEPETKKWGGNITKPMIDQMASYVKNAFPTLPNGVNVGPPGYKWRNSERYKVLDYVLYQYNHWITSGNIYAWRDAVLEQARRDGVTPMFSLNILGGGRQDRQGTWDCTGAGQAGKGPYYPNCRMTADQVRSWGRVIGVAGCAMMMWRFDKTYMSKSSNISAFKDVASTLRSKPRRSCRRP